MLKSYREWKSEQDVINEMGAASSVYKTARGAGTASAGVLNNITQALYRLGQHPKNNSILTRVYKWIVKGVTQDVEIPEDEKAALIDAFPSASTGVSRLRRGAGRLFANQPAAPAAPVPNYNPAAGTPPGTP